MAVQGPWNRTWLEDARQWVKYLGVEGNGQRLVLGILPSLTSSFIRTHSFIHIYDFIHSCYHLQMI